jgi:hypothetical protein
MFYKVVDGCICRHLHLHCSDVENFVKLLALKLWKSAMRVLMCLNV